MNYRITCRELASQQPGTQSALLLGDAYIGILEPDKAIEVYETALKKNPRDATLASKIGQALVRTHHYNKASYSNGGIDMPYTRKFSRNIKFTDP